MLGESNSDRVNRRRAATRREILDAAWDVLRADGPAALSLRDLAARVGMRAPSLYSYFSSKSDLYDALFMDGYQSVLASYETIDRTADPLADLRTSAHLFVTLAVEDPVRYTLLFQRPIPGFVPSAAAYAPSVAVYQLLVERMAAAGVTAQHHLDLWTALLSGLAAQQVANDPGGDRWLGLVDDAVDMFLAHVRPRARARRKG